MKLCIKKPLKSHCEQTDKICCCKILNGASTSYTSTQLTDATCFISHKGICHIPQTSYKTHIHTRNPITTFNLYRSYNFTAISDIYYKRLDSRSHTPYQTTTRGIGSGGNNTLHQFRRNSINPYQDVARLLR